LQILTFMERNLTTNDVEYAEDTWQNCVTVETTDTLDYYQQIERCNSVTQPDIWYSPVIRVAKRDYVNDRTPDVIPFGSVQVVYSVNWPVFDTDTRDSRLLMRSDFRFILPTSLMDLFFLGKVVCELVTPVAFSQRIVLQASTPFQLIRIFTKYPQTAAVAAPVFPTSR
jgi:hypothetical protein